MGIFAAIVALLWLTAVGTSIYGLVLAFQASIILGILVLIIEPAPFILGIVGIFGHTDVAQRIADWLGL